MFINSFSLCILFVVCEVKCYNEEQNPTYMAASNPNGTWLHLNEKNLTEIPPTNQTVIESEEVEFDCLPKNPELTVNWYKDGTLLSEVENLQNRYQITENSTLIIQNVSISDHGGYECEVTNDDGDNQTAKVFLDVQYKAKAIFAPPEIFLPYGEPASIDCHFEANPPMTKLQWEKDGVLIDQDNMESVFFRSNGSLYITKTDERHSGRYTCTPFNDLGTEGSSPQMVVVVQRPPVFVASPLYVYARKAGEKVEMPCDAKHGDDGRKPTLIWSKKDGTALPVGRSSIKGGNLTISYIQKGDEGAYQCSASNRIAIITAETELLVEPSNASTVPFNLTAESSVDSVKVKWLPGEERSHNKKYSVWYKAVGTTKWEIRRVPSSETLEFIVSGLSADTEYEFMVLGMDEKEDGRFSKAVRVRTKRY